MMSDTAPIPPPLPAELPRDPLIGAKLGDYVVESLVTSGGTWR